jgi:hypothetical protein
MNLIWARPGTGTVARPEKYPVRHQVFAYANNGTGVYARPGRWVFETVSDALPFPTQFAGLRYFLGTVKELCLVALGDAPAGDQWRIRKGGTDYAVYLVDTTDPNASQVRVNTGAGVKAARLKT